ncbi:MAG: DotA/TraY family protein [Micavibrio sp.]
MVRTLFASGFGHIAYYMAQIYGAARLLPPNHAYLNIQNIGRFGISNVIIEAFGNLRFTRKNLDQIFIFVLLVCGLILLLAQFALLGFSLFVQNSHAGMGYAAFFVTPDTTQDIAHILMDRVFGIPGMFDSCVSQGIPCLNSTLTEGVFPFPYHGALHDMLSFYSIGLCVIGVIIFMYYIVTIVVETAQTGTPFGRRFNHVWAPIRMVVALALLVPLTYGLNGAQLLTLNVAKWGSALATNGWTTFVDTLVTASITPLGIGTAELIGEPEKPNPESLFQFFTVVAVCKKIYMQRENINIDAFLVSSDAAPGNRMLLTAADWQQATDFYKNGDIIIVFGEQNAKYTSEKGEVMPWCGELVLPQVDLTQPGSVSIQTSYYEGFIRRFWQNASTGSPTIGTATNLPAPNGQAQDFFFNAADRILEMTMVPDYADGMYPDDNAQNALLAQWTWDLGQYITAAVTAQISSDNFLNDMRNYGWAGAGIWYNRVAELNGALIAGIANIPEVRKWPLAMEAIAAEKSKKDKNVSAENRFLPNLADGKSIQPPHDMSMEAARALSSTYALWVSDNPQTVDGAGQAVVSAPSQNVFTDFVKNLFGLKGLFNMRDNADIHPLAQLVMIGKYLLEASIRNLGGAGITSIGAQLMGYTSFPAGAPAITQAFSTLLKTIGMMTLSIGFVLYYVVPFLPFLYFFFQVGGWIKGLFEAMVGLPLWALAHIRIDGDGLPGQAAVNGYFLIFDIFLRPILTIFGMIGGIAIFAAQVQVLNDIFELVITNVTGYNQEAATAPITTTPVAGTSAVVPNPTTLIGNLMLARNFVDQLFYTVIYTMIVYMMGTASFKLVYMIPDNMLRWMGSSVDGFGEIAKQTPEELVGKMYGGSMTVTGQVTGAFRMMTSRAPGGGGSN